MGSKKVLKKLKKKGIALLFCGILMILCGAFLCTVYTEKKDSTIIIFAVGMFACGGILSYFGIDYLKGKGSRYAKKNPKIFELADDLVNNPVYQDDFVVISGRAIAPKKDFSAVADLEDVLAIYESIQRTNGIVTSHTVKLELINGRAMNISVYARKKATKDNILLTIAHYCPNAAVGYSAEAMEYVRAKRRAYKEALKNR